MPLFARELAQLKKIIAIAQDLIEKAEAAPPKDKPAKQGETGRTRRSGKELAAFRKMLKAERKRGVSATDLAKEHGISKAYIYSLR
jgi:hypothetical protein